MKPIFPIIFIDKLVKKKELDQPFALTEKQREVLRVAFAFGPSIDTRVATFRNVPILV